MNFFRTTDTTDTTDTTIWKPGFRSETTKDKAGALPPTVFAVQRTGKESDARFPAEEIEFCDTTSGQYTICERWPCF